MSSLADREAYRTERRAWRHSVAGTELWFWAALAVLSAVIFAAAVAGISYADQLPPAAIFVGP